MNMKLSLFIVVAICDLSQAFFLGQYQRAQNLLNMSRILIFYGNSYKEHNAIDLSSAVDVLRHPKFDRNKKTVLYIHGYKEEINNENIQTIVAAYQHRNDHNILILDWITIAHGDYLLNALPNTITFSKLLSDALLKLFDNGLEIKTLHVVTHSLGSQLAGLVGREIQRKSNWLLKLKRITCLDPAFPGFYLPIVLIKPVNKKDAEFVDVIHTDTGIYGTPFSTGTVDFWPNGATLLQPGCSLRNFKILDEVDLCSHWRSWRFWAESVRMSSSQFPSQKCESMWAYEKGLCRSEKFASMGINCPTGISGNYFLRTRTESPYSY